MKIAVHGLPYIFLGLVPGIVGAVMLRKGMGAGWALMLPGFLFAAFSLYFFRDPERPLPTDQTKIYSPGDGRVLSIAKEDGRENDTIRIFLSVFNVHIQRLPVSGTVSGIEYVEGSFAAAMNDEAHANERNIVTIQPEGGRGPVVVEQIAGLIARRIRCWIPVGAKAVMGERYGLIQFGSQAAVHLPKGAHPVVKPGDRVAGGLTPIAAWENAVPK